MSDACTLLKVITRLPSDVQGSQELNTLNAIEYSIEYIEVLNEVLETFQDKYKIEFVDAAPTYFPVNGFQNNTMAVNVMLRCPDRNANGFRSFCGRLKGRAMKVRDKYSIGAAANVSEGNYVDGSFDFSVMFVVAKI